MLSPEETNGTGKPMVPSLKAYSQEDLAAIAQYLEDNPSEEFEVEPPSSGIYTVKTENGQYRRRPFTKSSVGGLRCVGGYLGTRGDTIFQFRQGMEHIPVEVHGERSWVMEIGSKETAREGMGPFIESMMAKVMEYRANLAALAARKAEEESGVDHSMMSRYSDQEDFGAFA